MKKHLAGYVYIVSNPSMEGLIKIGHASDVKSRIHQLNKVIEVPTPFQLEFEEFSNDVRQVVLLIHSELHDARVDIMRPYFSVEVEKAVDIAKNMLHKVGENPLYFQSLFPNHDQKWDKKTAVQVVSLYRKVPDVKFVSSIIGRSFMEVELFLNYIGVLHTTEFSKFIPYFKGIPRNCYQEGTFDQIVNKVMAKV